MLEWRATTALCPACVTPLFVTWHEDTALHGCATCGGAWLDNAGCRRLVAAALPEGVASTARASLDTVEPPAAGYRVSARGESAPRKCPWCDVSLGCVRFAGIEVDACGEHGTFFDPHELFAMNQAAVLKAAEDDAFVAEFKQVISADRRDRAWVRRPLG